MAQPRAPVRVVVFFCWFSAAVLITTLMAYFGVFDGLGDALYEFLKPIAKFFFQ
ncbi:MAG: hypothetical protein ABR874_01565 [Candidatus Sulfotelmatobacter sp.]|jgi:hypothetical protein